MHGQALIVVTAIRRNKAFGSLILLISMYVNVPNRTISSILNGYCFDVGDDPLMASAGLQRFEVKRYLYGSATENVPLSQSPAVHGF
jgi:hypothetical protein